MNIDIWSSDIKDLDEVIERQFDISNYYGTSLFDKHGRLIPQHEYEFAIEPHTYLALMMDMQEQINDISINLKHINKELELQKKWIKTMKEELNAKL